MIDLTEDQKHRWLEHKHKYNINSNRHNPKKQSKTRYIFLASEVTNLGSVSKVVKTHHAGRTTVLNAIRFVEKYEDETRTVLPGEGKCLQ